MLCQPSCTIVKSVIVLAESRLVLIKNPESLKSVLDTKTSL